ncbi:bacterial extracellular solute-binding family protein, partial [Vibrio parahaemolyticus EKP-008]
LRNLFWREKRRSRAQNDRLPTTP